MKNKIIDKWESIPEFVLGNASMLFNGIYLPKGSYLNVHSVDLIQFAFRGNNNPRVLLRSPEWKLYELELVINKYERVVPELNFSSAKLVFNDNKERHSSRRALEGIVTGRPIDEVTISGFDVFYLKESGEDHFTDFEFYDERDKINSVKYDIDVDCGILVNLSNGNSVYMDYNVNHGSYNVFFGREELILNHAYLKTQWFDYPVKVNSIKDWKRRKTVLKPAQRK